MDADALIDHLDAEGRHLVDAAARRGLAEPAGVPDWTVRDLVIHVGGVHRWATTVVGGGTREEIEAANARMGEAPPDDALLDWFRDGHATLVATLRAAPADLEAFTFLPAPSARHFWARRQAHETAVHRSDAEGGYSSYDRDLAQDGIEEVLAWGTRRGFAVPEQATLALRPSDGPPLLLRFGGERTVVEPGDGPADATVEGTSSDLYLWLWNRPCAARVSGDAKVAALWGRHVRISWS